jgi:hypothetical protein
VTLKTISTVSWALHLEDVEKSEASCGPEETLAITLGEKGKHLHKEGRSQPFAVEPEVDMHQAAIHPRNTSCQHPGGPANSLWPNCQFFKPPAKVV